MAEPIKFPEANMKYVADGCNDLPAYSGQYDDGTPIIISCWQLSPEEIEEVVRTGRIYLHIYGSSQPPVYINGARPFSSQTVDN